MTADRQRSSPPSGREHDEPLDAGELGAWLRQLDAALAGRGSVDVPCGSCTACCRSSQFVHIAPDETDTLAHVPRALTVPAPGAPPGHVLLGYDEHGHCPLLVDGACSIYDHRPRTCRTYDCRVFAAADVAPDETKVEITRRVERWRFRVAGDEDRMRLAAIRAAGRYLRDHAADLADRDERVPTAPTQLAVVAVEVHGTFLAAAPDRPVDTRAGSPTLDEVADAVRRLLGPVSRGGDR